MRAPRRIVLTILVASLALSLLAGNVQATNLKDDACSMTVSIRNAYYLDLDADQKEDDIVTEFIVSVPSTTPRSSLTLIHCLLELPSGRVFSCSILVLGFYSEIDLILGWYNTAYEPGWYTFSVTAYLLGSSVHAKAYDTIAFDPPTEGEPGSPVVSIMAISMVS